MEDEDFPDKKSRILSAIVENAGASERGTPAPSMESEPHERHYKNQFSVFNLKNIQHFGIGKD